MVTFNSQLLYLRLQRTETRTIFVRGVNMANDRAVHTENIATIFTVVTNAAVGSVDLFCISDACLQSQRQQEHRHVKGSLVQRGLKSS